MCESMYDQSELSSFCIDISVEQAMNAIHSAGVVHLDWYLSNFMWQYKPESGELSVKIIDFDSAHLMSDSLTTSASGRY